MTKTVTLYKVLGEKGEPIHGGKGKWHLPSHGRPGKWVPVVKNIKACERGYHVVTVEQLPEWLGPTIYEVEVRGERIDQADKSCVSEARLVRKVTTWNERTARLLACDFAEHVLPIFEKHHPNDSRPRDAIAVARRFANGKATKSELAAARDAAWDAARARVAAWDAAGVAARDAAWAAAWDAAWAAARAAERAWQAGRLRDVLANGYPK